MLCSYTSRDGIEQHKKTENFKTLFGTAAKEGLFSKPPYALYTKTVGGYDWDREKIEVR